MKYLIPLMLLLAQTTYGQQGQAQINITQRKKIDSLQLLLKKHPQEDSVRVILLCKLVKAQLNNKQYAQGLLNNLKVQKLSEKISYLKGQGLYLQNLGIFHQNNWIGFNYRWKAIQVFEELGDKEMIKVYYPVFFNNTSASPAGPLDLDSLLNALIYLKKTPNDAIEAELLQTICSELIHSNKLSEALDYSKKAFHKYKKIQNYPGMYCALFNQLLIYLKQGNKINALKSELLISKLEDKIIQKRELAMCLYLTARFYGTLNRNVSSINYYIKSEKACENTDEILLFSTLENLSLIYNAQGFKDKALKLAFQRLRLGQKHSKDPRIEFALPLLDIAWYFCEIGDLSKAIKYNSVGSELAKKNKYPFAIAFSWDVTAQIFMKQGKYQQAIAYLLKAIALNEKIKQYWAVAYQNLHIANCYQSLGQTKTSLEYALKAYRLASQNNLADVHISASILLAHLYSDLKQFEEANRYYKIHTLENDSISAQNSARSLVEIEVQNAIQKSTQDIELLEKDKKIQNIWLWSAFGALSSFIILAWFLYHNNQVKQKVNKQLASQKENLDKMLNSLKSTQAQLIQSEKLASLGELTAGIAHEIQNPLNFVNNFAEVSAEMLDDMTDELDKGDTLGAKAIAADLKTNLQKINHHGQRASSIVKGMLEHSRAGDAMNRVSTDLNALADEYLRLAYHGLRAKDSSFNAMMETHFDPDLPKIEVIPQDIGRVLLNLINNAFYAVHQRAVETRFIASPPQIQYQPTVTIITKKLENAIEISVQDNGNGIPETIKDKIFQPFFTTKPTGQGTGLGLSLAYDIVTKGHGGTLEVESTEGGGSEFTIKLSVV